ncbi:MAG TPA: hypothetical protein VN821_09320 [Candidatus Udaeobacter sp.]|nr:hypothetical protein [Candidatus Udaeobacter sp.]
MASASEGKTVRKLILAALVAGGFAATADAANEKTQTLPASSTAPAVSQPAPAAPPPAAAIQPAPQPPPPPKIVEAPWPYNVPSLKPGTGLALAATAAKVAPAAGTAKTATTNPIAATTTPTQVASLPPNPANAAAVATTQVTLRASSMPGLKPLLDPAIVWTVYRADANNQPTERLASQTGPQAQFSLAPGPYVVAIRDAESLGSQFIIVGSQPLNKVIPLNLSVVQVKMIPYTGAKPVIDPVHWEMFANALGRPGPDSKIADRFEPMTVFHLSAGYYVLRTHYQGTHTDLAMLIEAGVTYHYTVDLYAASVAAQAVAAGGKRPKADVTWQVVRAQAGSDGQHEVIATNTGTSPNFLLREGNYVLIATAADGTTGQAPVQIMAGKAQHVRVMLKPGPKTANGG